jgi:hypothetical protein
MASRKRTRRASSSPHPPLSNLVHNNFTLLRIDAPPHVEVPDGVYATVVKESLAGLKQASHVLQNPKPRAHTLPDIVFLPSTTSVLVVDEVVGAKPHLLVRSDDLDLARQRQGALGALGASTQGYRGDRRMAPGPRHTQHLLQQNKSMLLLTPPPVSKKTKRLSDAGQAPDPDAGCLPKSAPTSATTALGSIARAMMPESEPKQEPRQEADKTREAGQEPGQEPRQEAGQEAGQEPGHTHAHEACAEPTGDAIKVKEGKLNPKALRFDEKHLHELHGEADP